MDEEQKIKTMKLKCLVCGELKIAGAPRIEKLVAKMGSLEKVTTEYVCRTCRKK